MKKQFLWMFAAILTLCGLTSCSDSDDDDATSINPLEKQMDGTWYASYDAQGTVAFGGTNAAYSQVVDVYQFAHGATGTLTRFFFASGEDVPFTDIKTDYSPATHRMWQIDGSLQAEGVNGQRLTLSRDTVGFSEMFAHWDDDVHSGHNGSASANDEFKPMGVDHSRWMAQLADGRLVADLSLPGSHNSCTAEGWRLAQLVGDNSAKAQDLTISEQLQAGVRVFDLRPERVLGLRGYELRCSNGVVQTNMLVREFFLRLKEFLQANPTEFCIVTCNLDVTPTDIAVGWPDWQKRFAELLQDEALRQLFVGFKPRLTVGEMRSRVLLLSRYEYDGTTVGGICQDWSNDKMLANQTKGAIKAADDSKTPLWTQDYYAVGSTLGDYEAKDEAIRRMLDATAARDLTAAAPAWVFNYPAGYTEEASSDHYRKNAERTNRLVIDYLKNPLHNAATGIVMMDYAGMDRSHAYNGSDIYETSGMELIEALINQNFRTPATIDASLFSVCTLNVDGLPAYDFVNNDGPDTEFTPVISRYLADKAFDFIGVQENFDFDKELGRCLIANYEHDSWAGGMTLDNLFNDGVNVAVFHTDGCKAWWRSHLTTVRTDSIRWNDRYGYDTHCRDEAATKGFRRYEITTPEGYQLVVYNMHMEASERWDEVGGTDSLDRDARLKQWIQLREHIFSKLDTRPVLVIGDFNTYYCRDDMKANFIDAINASGRATCGDAWIEKCRDGVYPKLEDDVAIADDGDWLGWTMRGEMPDKILYINPVGGHSVELLSCTYDNAANSRDYFKPSGYAKDHEEPLGDHFPLFATFRLK